jgi:hypothetical protein
MITKTRLTEAELEGMDESFDLSSSEFQDLEAKFSRQEIDEYDFYRYLDLFAKPASPVRKKFLKLLNTPD